MNKKRTKLLIVGFILLGMSLSGYSQEQTSYRLSLEQAVEMGLQNHQQLKISQASLETSRQQVNVSKSQQLPTISFSASAFYLGDALVLDKDWSKVQSVDMPHFGNTFGLQASQSLYNGGVIKNSIELAELQEQLSELDLASDEQDIKFLIISNYLDIYNLTNQLEVLEQNKVLAEQLYDNIKKMHNENMVTRNELIRAELGIQDINQTILVTKNNQAILSNQLSYALGLPNNTLIIPTEDIDTNTIAQSKFYYTEIALEKNQEMQKAEMNIEIANKHINIQKSNWFPALSATGGYNMQRPITSTSPVVDMYSNSWHAGLSLSYNLDNLYKNKRQVNLSKTRLQTAQESLTYTQQNVEMDVNSAFIKYNEAEQQAIIMNDAMKLANENYKIVRAKYLNQLAIIPEMTDASNAKLNAELNYTTAVIKTLYQYYNLLRATGTL